MISASTQNGEKKSMNRKYIITCENMGAGDYDGEEGFRFLEQQSTLRMYLVLNHQ